MKICLSCRQASPRGSVYCQGCSRTFGTKLCANKHPNAPSPRVQFCATCGSPEMTEPTRFLNLSWAAPLLAGLIALFLWRWGLTHLPLLGGLVGRLSLMLMAMLLDTTPCGVLGGLHRAAAWTLTLWVLGWMLTLAPGRGGGRLAALPAHSPGEDGRPGRPRPALARGTRPPPRPLAPAAQGGVACQRKTRVTKNLGGGADRRSGDPSGSGPAAEG